MLGREDRESNLVLQQWRCFTVLAPGIIAFRRQNPREGQWKALFSAETSLRAESQHYPRGASGVVWFLESMVAAGKNPEWRASRRRIPCKS